MYFEILKLLCVDQLEFHKAKGNEYEAPGNWFLRRQPWKGPGPNRETNCGITELHESGVVIFPLIELGMSFQKLSWK